LRGIRATDALDCNVAGQTYPAGSRRAAYLGRMTDLEARAPQSTDRGNGRMRVALSNALVGVWKENYGRGPTGARTIIDGTMVFVVLQDGLTRNEETLLAAGHERTVREFRLCFQETMREKFQTLVEEITGRKVLAHESQFLFEPTMTIEVFVLDAATE
jgi:uncharacterized protein YbcI